jgi:CRISPR/Cas system-associated protein Cas10 (large subunit of type III CRISPR-Cas system)
MKFVIVKAVNMTRGGKREGAGRPRISEDKKAKKYTFALYSWEVEKVRQFIKTIRHSQIIEDEV